MPFVCYNTNNLSMVEKRSLLIDCRDISYAWQADVLDCSISYSRRYFDCTFDEILCYLNESAYVFVINRGIWNALVNGNREHFEIGFRSMSSPIDYFLFIQVDSDKMPPILGKYKLMPIH